MTRIVLFGATGYTGRLMAEADTARPDSVRDLVGPGDVLVSTVGPFLTRGEPAVAAAVGAGAAYLDATGEPPFLRRVFEHHGPKAAGRCGLVPAFGYDFVPGNLAGALALAVDGDLQQLPLGGQQLGGAVAGLVELALGAEQHDPLRGQELLGQLADRAGPR